ncbi:cyclin-dependent kinase inhibitor 1-like isoform X1 [Solanum tuberosum]|uniref:Cyclin-dependent kinase inhibitor n=1 Tax=Solanum tuberosum TaxID=4113 RepID=M1BAE7_SOLTU|nr:PREDICTED: cyclin-dependent kinase inhibitor 1-like isoform X1 [Solanum tuberosum]XP_006339909.1 PREDICTED: cyclin-dependent kinase inhibitor 1-like isoform X1 [Solanum tuberosum]
MRRRYKCKSKGIIGEVVIMEVAEVAVKMTREREVLEVVDTRKRKKRDGDLEMSPTVARVRRNSVVSVVPASFESPASELSSQGNTVSCKPANFHDGLASGFGDDESSNVTKGSSKFVDLDEDSVEIATSYSELRESRETILSSKFKVEFHKVESTPKPQHAKSCRRRLTEAIMPSEAELDEFFAAAEKDLHKHFAEKYNFDFAKEEPLEGRYEWVRQ